MEQIKRPRSNISHDYDDSKRKKISITTTESNYSTEESISVFEDLSNELIYEIFEFLNSHHAFQGFFDLNKRFQNLFLSNLPIKINISSISKSSFQRYLTDVIVPHTYRIQSFRLSNPFAADMSLLLFPIMTNLTGLTTLIINNIESDYIEKVINHLSSLSVLSSLTIISVGYIKNQNDIYQKIFRLPALKYCQLLIETLRRLLPLSISTDKFSPIEHLVINNKVSLNQLDSLLSYVPQLSRLSFGHLDGRRISRTHRSSITLNCLTNVSLKLYSVDFNDFEVLATDFFRQVQVLRIETSSGYVPTAHERYLNADRWERFISTHMVNLRIFDLQIVGYLCDNDHHVYETDVSNFNSLFWVKHQWVFEYQYYKERYFNGAIFYSTRPYRRKYYMLYEESNKNIRSCDFKTENLIHHVYIHNTNAMKQFVGNFPHAMELTLSKTFDLLDDSIVVRLNHVIPLRQLTKLILDYHRLPVEQVIKLLHFTPNIYTMKLESIFLYQTDSVSIEQNDIFQIVSNTNIVTNVTIGRESALENIQLLVTLFPRLEYLTINLYKEALESIVRFLLSKFNDNTRHLSSLCISKQRKDFMEILSNLLESEKLLDDYNLKVINRKLYLWW